MHLSTTIKGWDFGVRGSYSKDQVHDKNNLTRMRKKKTFRCSNFYTTFVLKAPGISTSTGCVPSVFAAGKWEILFCINNSKFFLSMSRICNQLTQICFLFLVTTVSFYFSESSHLKKSKRNKISDQVWFGSTWKPCFSHYIMESARCSYTQQPCRKSHWQSVQS